MIKVFLWFVQSPLERKKKFVSIHQEIKDHGHHGDDDSYDDDSPSFHLASQYLADSSLSEDVSQYFSMSNSMGVRFMVLYLFSHYSMGLTAFSNLPILSKS